MVSHPDPLHLVVFGKRPKHSASPSILKYAGTKWVYYPRPVKVAYRFGVVPPFTISIQSLDAQVLVLVYKGWEVVF